MSARSNSAVASAALATVTVLVSVSCGARSGLLVDEEAPLADASFDALTDVTLTDGPVLRDAVGDSPDAPDSPTDASVDAPLEGTVACMPGTFDFQLAVAQLLFVLDRSGSMSFALDSDTAPPAGQPTRWSTVHDALAQAIVPFDTQLQMGAKFFPLYNPDAFTAMDACQTAGGVDITPAFGNAQSILDVFSTTKPVGGTPTAASLAIAGNVLAATRGAVRAIVVATDGAPNCNPDLDPQTCTCSEQPASTCRGMDGQYECLDDAATIATIASIFQNEKIPVYVIGIGETQSFGAVLDAMAVAGGRANAGEPKYIDGTTAANIAAAFTSVRDSVATCSYLTPSSPQDPNAITVTINGVTIARDPMHVEGWDWIDQAYGELELFGTACTSATGATVQGTVACTDGG